MLYLLLMSALALAAPTDALNPEKTGQLVIDAKVPAEVLIDGQQVAQVYMPAKLVLAVEAGERKIRIYTDGTPEDLQILVPEEDETVLVIGRTGTTAGHRLVVKPVADDLVPIEFRGLGPVPSQVRFDNQRLTIAPGETRTIEATSGEHRVSFRAADGTAIWATGTLNITGNDVIIQVTEGRLPEVTGKGQFRANGG